MMVICSDIVIIEHDGRRAGVPNAPVLMIMTTISKYTTIHVPASPLLATEIPDTRCTPALIAVQVIPYLRGWVRGLRGL